MGRPLPARKAGYRLYGQFKVYLCHDKQVGKRPTRGGGKRRTISRCGRKPPKSSLLRAVNRALRRPGRVKMDRKTWVAAVEKWYNHALGYYVVRGKVGGFVDAAGKRAWRSPLRTHLKKHLGKDYPRKVKVILKTLKSAFRMKPLTRKEYANSVLSSKQRIRAKIRSPSGYDAVLATWLFDDHNWLFLCSKKSGVHGEFFREPTDSDRKDWPTSKNDRRKGDKTYLARTRRKLAECRKSISNNLRDLKLYQDKMAVGFFVGDKAAKALLWASEQAVLIDKAKWQKLLTLTKRDKLLKKTLMPVPQLWETPVTKVPKL